MIGAGIMVERSAGALAADLEAGAGTAMAAAANMHSFGGGAPHRHLLARGALPLLQPVLLQRMRP